MSSVDLVIVNCTWLSFLVLVQYSGPHTHTVIQVCRSLEVVHCVNILKKVTNVIEQEVNTSER